MSELEPALNQTIAVLATGDFVVETGEYYPHKPTRQLIIEPLRSAQQIMRMKLPAEETDRLLYKVQAIQATIALSLIRYEQN